MTGSTKKWLGQHWLTDIKTLKAVAEAAGVGRDDTVLEIGPGQGSLTSLLVERAHRVVAIEKDAQLAADLKRRVPALNLEIISGDVLQFNLEKLPDDYKLVANIPYYLTSRLLRNLLENSNPPAVMSLMVQKEVAERIVARPGQMSLLAVSVQYYAQPTLIRVVPKELFDPRPRVDSAVVRIERLPAPLFKAERAWLFRLFKAGFAGKRKQLKNSLAAGLHLKSQQVSRALQPLKIDPTLRAQDLSLGQWGKVYRVLIPLAKKVGE